MSQVSTEHLSPPAVRAWTNLLRAHAATSRALSAELQSRHGLSLNAYEALHELSVAEGGRMRRIDLARRLALTPSGITRLLEGLEASGFVTRRECVSDLRVAYAELTDAGRAKLDEASCAHVGSVRAVLEERLDCDEIETLAALLAKL
jgi:DNA-binding MarR family transcriptional regulator